MRLIPLVLRGQEGAGRQFGLLKYYILCILVCGAATSTCISLCATVSGLFRRDRFKKLLHVASMRDALVPSNFDSMLCSFIVAPTGLSCYQFDEMLPCVVRGSAQCSKERRESGRRERRRLLNYNIAVANRHEIYQFVLALTPRSPSRLCPSVAYK